MDDRRLGDSAAATTEASPAEPTNEPRSAARLETFQASCQQVALTLEKAAAQLRHSQLPPPDLGDELLALHCDFDDLRLATLEALAALEILAASPRGRHQRSR